MKFTWISDKADTLALAMRVQNEGNEVDFCILDKTRAPCGNGMVNKIKDWRQNLSKERIYVFDMVGSGAIAASLAKAGYMVFGASPLMDKLELDRPFGTKVMQVSGIPVPPTQIFHDFDSAIRFLETKGGRYVFKPNENMNTAYTYVGYNDEDMIHFLNNAKSDPAMNKVVEFELQEFQEGVEVSLEGLFNGTNWVDGWWNITFERKRKMTGDLGHNTGCSIDVVKILADQMESPMVRKTLAKLTPMLQQIGYKGVLDINCIYKDALPMGLEWTSRFGINAIYSMMELVKDDLGKIIADVVLGNLTSVNTEKSQFAASVRCTLPEKPLIHRRILQNIRNFKHIHPLDVMMDDHANLVSADTDFILAIVTAYGSTIEKASDFVYHLIDKTDKFGILDLEYRLDCGVSARKMYDKLFSWQLLKESRVVPLPGEEATDSERPNDSITGPAFEGERAPFDSNAHISFEGHDVVAAGDHESKVDP